MLYDILTVLAMTGLMLTLSSMAGGSMGAHLLNKKGAVDDNGKDKGGVMPFGVTMLPEVLFGMPFGYVAYLYSGSIWIGLTGWLGSHIVVGVLGWLWSYASMEQGHGNAMHDGVARFDFPDRKQGLDVIVRPLCTLITAAGLRLGFKPDLAPRSKWYCRVFMGVKGFLIGMPVPPVALALAIAWPASYAICFQPQKHLDPMKRSSVLAEKLSGAFAGFFLGCAIVILRGFHGA